MQRSSTLAYLCLKFPSLPQDNAGNPCLPPHQRPGLSHLVYVSSMNVNEEEEETPPKKRRIGAPHQASIGTLTDDLEQKVADRLSRASMGQYLWTAGIRIPDLDSCIRSENRSSVMVLSFLALHACLTICQSLKQDEKELLLTRHPVDLDPRDGQLTSALYGETDKEPWESLSGCFTKGRGEHQPTPRA